MEYKLIRSRRRTLSVQITPAGEIIVRAPNRMSRREIDSFLRAKEGWISLPTWKKQPVTAASKS